MCVRYHTVLTTAATALAAVAITVAQPVLSQETAAPALKPAVAAPEAQAPKAKAASETIKSAAKTDPAKDSAKAAGRVKNGGQSILVLVNDEPITVYEVEQRQRLMAGGGGGPNIQARAQENFKALIKAPGTTERLKQILNDTIKANEGKSREQILAIFEQKKKDFGQSLQRQAVDNARSAALPALKKEALEELVEERLKLQEAKRLNVVVGDDDLDRIIKGFADRNKMTPDQFAQQLKSMGTDINAMRARFRANMSWNEVIRRRYGSQIAVTERDVDKLVAANPAAGEDEVELQVQRITLPITGKLDQKLIAQRLGEAEGVSAKFTGCKSSGAAAAGVQGAKFEDLGTKKPSAIGEPTRSLLLNAKDGEMLPPSVGSGGVELWIVCGRTVIKADDQKRETAQNELRQKEFEVLARKHLKDLRQDAAIEYR